MNNQIDWANKWNVASTKAVTCWKYLDSKLCDKRVLFSTRDASYSIRLMGNIDELMEVLKEAIDAGYGELPFVWAIKLYQERN